MKRTDSNTGQLKLNLRGSAKPSKTSNIVDLCRFRDDRMGISGQKTNPSDQKIIDAFRRHAKKLDW